MGITIQSVTLNGTVLNLVVQRKILALYALIAFLCATFVIVTESLISSYTVNLNKQALKNTKFSQSCLAVVFLLILTLLFAYSYVKITKALKTNDLNMTLNKPMLTMNFCLISVILLTWIAQWLLYGTASTGAFYTSYAVLTISKLVIKVVFLALIESFGQSLNLRSRMTANG